MYTHRHTDSIYIYMYIYIYIYIYVCVCARVYVCIFMAQFPASALAGCELHRHMVNRSASQGLQVLKQ